MDNDFRPCDSSIKWWGRTKLREIIVFLLFFPLNLLKSMMYTLIVFIFCYMDPLFQIVFYYRCGIYFTILFLNFIFLNFTFQYISSFIAFHFAYSYGAIEAKKGNPPVAPSVMTPGGPLDLSTVLFRSRIIFIGQPINSMVAQRVISQLVTLAAIDEDADILVWL